MNTTLVLDIDRRLIQFQAQLLALAPPTRVLDMSFDSISSKYDVVEWIFKQEPFISFSRPGTGSSMIHLHGDRKRLVNISEMSRLFYAHYNTPITGKISEEGIERRAIYFEFDQHDSRYNTISSLLTYLINAIVWHFWLGRHKEIPDELSFLSTTRSWTVEDLYHLYATLLRDSIQEVHKLTIFISCFDQCLEDRRQWFLRRVLEEQSYSEARYRIIISTSTRDGLGTESLQKRARVNLANYPAIGKSIAELTIDLQAGLTHLTRHKTFRDFQPELDSLLKGCGDATHLGHMILKWLGNHSRGGSGFGIKSKIKILSSPTVDNIVCAFILYLEPGRQERAKNAFNWIKHAAEPWSPESLVEALAVYEDGLQERSFNDLDVEATMHDIEQALGGIVIVKNGDVKFSHPSFYHAREVGIGGNAEERAAQVNSQIAETCLRYFQLEEAQEALEKFSPENFEGGIWDSTLDAVVIYHSRAGLAEYAVRFWPRHFKASGRFKPHNLVGKLFESAESRAAWEVPFWLLSNPFTRIQRSYISPVPILAMLELEDSAKELVGILGHNPDQHVEKNCWYAITEAARVDNKTTVDQLLEHVAVDLDELSTALFWAAAAGNADIVDVLVKKIPNLKSFEWPKDIMHRAAAIGMPKLLQMMVLICGCDINKIGGGLSMPPLQIAVWRDNIITVEGLLTLKHNPDLALGDRNGGITSPMTLAASRGNPRMIESLSEGGVSLEMKGITKFGPVQLAVMWQKHKAVKRLIQAGADFGSGETGNRAALYERPPLVVAASTGSRECVRALLEYKADPDKKCATGTALYEAVKNNHTDVVQLLLNHVPKPSMRVVPWGQPILLMQAVCTGNAELVSLLIKHGAKVDVIDRNGDLSYKTPLSRACKEGYLEVVTELLKKANINYTGGGSNAPLFAALHASQVEVAKYLLRDKSVNLKWKKDDGMGLLHAAWDLPDIIPELLRRGVPVDDYMENHGTALHIAARLNRPKSIEALLRSKPTPDLEYKYKENIRKDEVGCTALLLACLEPAPECIELLLDAGANPRAKNSNGKDAVDLLLRKEPDSKGVWKCLKLLISRRKRVPIDGKNSDGYTPLALAVKNGNISAAKYLIEQGANVNVVGPSFGSILHLAVKGRSLDLVKLLVDSGANCNMAHHEYVGGSLLSMAKSSNEHEIRRYLRSQAVNLDDEDGGGELGYPK